MNTGFRQTALQLLKFGIVGVSNNLINYIAYYILLKCNIHYILANSIGYLLGIFNSYYWNNRIVFRAQKRGKTRKKFFRVFVCYGFTYIITTILLFLFVEKFIIPKVFAPILVLFITVPINFLLNKFWAFKEEKNEDHYNCDTNL